MKLYKGTRWWILWPCLAMILLGLGSVALRKRYSPDEARRIFIALHQQQATEEEIIRALGHHSQLVTTPGGAVDRHYFFSKQSLNSALVEETRCIFHDGKLQYMVTLSENLSGMMLWEYRWKCLLNAIVPGTLPSSKL